VNNLAKALVMTIQYLGVERNDENYTEDDDLKIIEETAALLQDSTNEEKALLVKTAKELGLENWANQIGIE